MNKLEVKTWDEIQDMEFVIEEPIIDGLLYNGTYLFVGSPKIGKSFFMLQLCYHISKGLPLWDRETKLSTTLYIAREDDYKRIQRRLHRMYGVGTGNKMIFAKDSEGITGGLMQQLEDIIKDYPDIKVIILDTLQKVRGSGNGSDQYNYGADYEMMGIIKDFTDRHRICVIIVHHTRKMEATDPFDMISGSNGLLGAVDGAFMMYKKNRTDQEAKLCVTGRDVEDTELTLKKNPKTSVWECSESGTSLGCTYDPFLKVIDTFLSQNGNRWKGTATELHSMLPPKDRQDSPSSLSRKINVVRDELFKEYGIKTSNSRTSTTRTILLERNSEYCNKQMGKWLNASDLKQMEIPFE